MDGNAHAAWYPALGSIGLVVAILGCGASPRTPAASQLEPATRIEPTPAGEPYPWQPMTRSPQAPAAPRDDLAQACSVRDRALDQVAAWLAARQLAGQPSLDVEAITDAMRAEGAPYVWPHVWTLTGGHAPDAAARFRSWLGEVPTTHELRCGGAVVSAAEREASVGLAVDVLADLEPLPTSTKVGTWLDVSARLLVPASAVSVVVLGPRGSSFAVPSSLEGGRVRARFHADREGSWLVQILATVAGGPRPVAEAQVVAGEPPTTLAPALPAPGENSPAAADGASSLYAMVTGARASEGLAPLRRDARLDRIAEAHAAAMQRTGQLAHDAGDGPPDARVLGAGLSPQAVGENVAHAADAAHAHRSLWRSPSHRENLLEPSFDAVGIGTALGTDQTLWVCEVFATLGRQ